MFPTINHLNDLLPFIKDNPQFRVQEQDNGTTVVCYMLQDEDTFRGVHEEYYKECRGITFDTKHGHVVSRTLHKFQNVGENENTQPHLIPWDKITRIMDKRDGSMITFVRLHNGTEHCVVRAKTKKTFTSAEAIAATKFLHDDMAKHEWVHSLLKEGFTPTFEWTSPKFPIVLLYDKDELTLLQVRDNRTGEYFDAFEMEGLRAECPFPIVPNLLYQFPHPRDLLDLALVKEGVEGWIVQTDEGEMWKVKTKWYCELHHSVTFTRWRDVARTVLDDKSDDLKAAFAMTGRDIQPIIDVENKIFREIQNVQDYCDEVAGIGKGLNQSVKEMAMMHKERPHFREVMRTFNGQPINWLEWYLKNHIDTWSLEVIPTSTQNEDLDEHPA